MNQKWLNDPRLEELSWEKRTFFVNWLKDNAYKKKEELLPAAISLQAQLKKKNLSLNATEQALLTDILLDSMSAQEKQQFQLLKTMLNRRSK